MTCNVFKKAAVGNVSERDMHREVTFSLETAIKQFRPCAQTYTIKEDISWPRYHAEYPQGKKEHKYLGPNQIGEPHRYPG